MRELDVFGLIRLLQRNQVPLVTFLTALDEYATSIFEANGLDYILKPPTPPGAEPCKNVLDRKDHKFDEMERIRAAATHYKMTAHAHSSLAVA